MTDDNDKYTGLEPQSDIPTRVLKDMGDDAVTLREEIGNTEAIAKSTKQAVEESIKVSREAISRAQKISKSARKAADESGKVSQEAIRRAEKLAKSAEESARAYSSDFEKAIFKHVTDPNKGTFEPKPADILRFMPEPKPTFQIENKGSVEGCENAQRLRAKYLPTYKKLKADSDDL